MRTQALWFQTCHTQIACRNEATLWKRWEPKIHYYLPRVHSERVGMKPLSERDENPASLRPDMNKFNVCRNEATLWKRWELSTHGDVDIEYFFPVGMKPLSERDENVPSGFLAAANAIACRNEATLWKRWEPIIHAAVLFTKYSCRNEATLWKRWELNSLVPY